MSLVLQGRGEYPGRQSGSTVSCEAWQGRCERLSHVDQVVSWWVNPPALRILDEIQRSTRGNKSISLREEITARLFQIQVPGESWELLPTPIISDSCASMQIQGRDENTRRFIRCFGAKSTRSPISPKRMGLYAVWENLARNTIWICAGKTEESIGAQ
ncbi:hypothetical protein EV421DRAFT_1731591 [Armillaria borealis]|uniref:Uncharacterized protein n=1 Tax=Armillaria borealis TaxID=47425 RepID=A0AA39MYY0_9AGAR|nr:hypothetical protein EV421DRAFT_1731591 [Armillaria borealis]